MSTTTFPSNGKTSDEDVLNAFAGGKPDQDGGKKPQVKPAKQQQPKEASDDEVLAAFSGVKKKDGGSTSSPTTSGLNLTSPSPEDIGKASQDYQNKNLTPDDISVLGTTSFGKTNGLATLTPDQKKIYADAHNGAKLSELNSNVYDITNTAFPKTTDAKLNDMRDKIISGVQKGDPETIKNTRDKIVSNIQKQIDDFRNKYMYATPMGPAYNLDEFQQAAVKKLTDQQDKIKDTFNQYAVNALANSKEMQAQIKTEVSGAQQPAGNPNLAANDLGKGIEKIYGGLPNPNGNMDYERTKVGLDAIIQNKQMKINDLITKGFKTKNQVILNEANKQIDELRIYQGKADNLINDFPDVQISQVARLIGDDIADYGKGGFGIVISKNDVLNSAKRIEAKSPGFIAKYGKAIDVVAESEGSGFGAVKSGLVPTGGLVGSFKSAVESLGLGAAEGVAHILGDKPTELSAASQEEGEKLKGTKFGGATPTKVVFDNESKALLEKPNEYYGKKDWNSIPNYVGKALPGLLAWAATEGAAAGIAGGLLKMGEGAKAFTALATASYATSYNDNRKLADSLVEDTSSEGEAHKSMLANFFTLTTAGAFHMVGYSPSKFVENAISKSVASDGLKLFEENGWKDIPKNKIEAYVKDVLLPKIKAFGKGAASNLEAGGKVGAASVADASVKNFVSQVVSPKTAPLDPKEQVESFTEQTLFMGMLGLPKSIVEGAFEPTVAHSFYDIGLTAPQYIERINAKVKTGDYTQDQANKAIAVAKTMQEEVAKVQDQTTKDGLPLTIGQKRDIALQNFRKRAAQALSDSGQDISTEKINNDADQQIKDTKSKNTHLPLEETHAFKTGKNEEGKAVKSIEEITDNPDGKYTYENDRGKEITTSGAEYLSNIEKSKEYEPPEDKDSESKDKETGKAEKAEGTHTPEQIEKAAAVVDKAIEDKKIPDTTAGKAKENPVKFLSDVADQSYGITRDSEGNPVQSDLPDAEKAARDQYGNDIVDTAKELFPKENNQLTQDHVDGAVEDIKNQISELRLSDGTILDGDREKYNQLKKALSTLQIFKKRATVRGGGAYEAENITPEEATEAHRNAKFDGDNPELVTALDKSILSPKPDKDEISKLRVEEKSPTGPEGKEEKPQRDGQEIDEKGNVTQKEGGAEVSPSKQKAHNDLLDKVARYNAMKSSVGEAGKPKIQLLNEIRLEAQELGLTPDYANGHISKVTNEAGNEIQRKSEKTNRSETVIDKTAYRPETHDFVGKMVSGELPLDQVAILGEGSRYMSRSQRAKAIDDIRNGKDTVGAKAVYDAVEKMHETGQVEIRDNTTGETKGVPMQEYLDAFKEPIRELSDEEITALNSDLGEDTFNTIFDNELNPQENEQDSGTTSAVKQPSEGTAVIDPEKPGQYIKDTEINPETHPTEAAAAYRSSAERIKEEDPEGAKLLIDQANDLDNGYTKPPGEGATKEGGEPSGSTGVKKAVIESERELSGKTKIENQLKRDFPTVIEGAKKLIKDNPRYTETLKNLIDKSLRPLTAEETVALSLRKAELQKESQKVSKDLIEAIKGGADETELRMQQVAINIERDNIDRIATKTNYEKGLSLAVNKILIAEDYSAEKLIQKAKALTDNGELSKEHEQKLTDLAAKLEDAQKRLDEQSEKISKLEAEKEVKKLVEKENAKGKTKEKKEKILAERKSLIDDFKKEWKGDPNTQRQGLPFTDKMVVIIGKLARNYVQDGVLTLQEVVGNIYNDLKEHAEGLTERDIRDAFSGYDQPKRTTYSEISGQMKDLRKQAGLVSKIEDVKAGKGLTDEQRDKKDQSPEVMKLKADLAEAMKLQGVDPYSEKAIKQFKTRLKNKRNELLEKIRKGDYAKEVKKQIAPDKETMALQTEVSGLKRQIDKQLKKIDYENRPKWQKRMDFFVKWRRAVLLSSVATLGKLTSAAMERSITSPMEEIVGAMLSVVPGIRQFSLRAPREGGGINFLAEKKAAMAWLNPETYQEMIRALKEKGSNLDVLYGKSKDLPGEAIDAIGRIHNALKTPAKFNEYKRSYEKRLDFAIRNGFDFNDPVTDQTLRTQAYIDAKRSIFLQDNIFTDHYQTMVAGLQRGSKAEKATGAVLQTILPIVRVPTNFAWESASYAVGALKVLPTVYKAIKHGMDSIEPDEADFVMRALKKQGLGIGMIALGYMNPSSVGGYYRQGEKRKEGDLDAGDIELFGHKVPHFLLHAPLIEMLQIGATLRRVKDLYKAEGKEEGETEEGLLSAGKGLFGQVPFFNTAGTLGGAVRSAKTLSGFAGETAKSFIVPPTVQQIASDKDTDDEGKKVKRSPQTALEHIEMGVPGLRQNVPTADEIKEQKKQEKADEKERKLELQEEGE